MRITIDSTTFVATGRNKRGDEVGTVSVSGQARRAVRWTQASTGIWVIYVYGYVGRYRTSIKPWNATVRQDVRGLIVDFGRDDRSGLYNKQDAISYEPDTFAKGANAEFWEMQA